MEIVLTFYLIISILVSKLFVELLIKKNISENDILDSLENEKVRNFLYEHNWIYVTMILCGMFAIGLAWPVTMLVIIQDYEK